jgi:hypothetical protein
MMLGAAAAFPGLAAESPCYWGLPTLPEESLDSLVPTFGCHPLINLVACANRSTPPWAKGE